MLNRRSFLTTSSLAAISLATPGLLGRASAQGAALKIGVPVPISGAFAANGKFATIGAQMAAEEVAKAHGIEVSTLDLDTEGKPATADIANPFGQVMAKAGDVRDGGSFYERMGHVACWNSVRDETQYMVRKWNEFIAA